MVSSSGVLSARGVAKAHGAKVVLDDVDRTGAGTLEAVAVSAREGALDCLARTRVRLRPWLPRAPG